MSWLPNSEVSSAEFSFSLFKNGKFEVILTVYRRQYVEIKYQLEATDVFYFRSYCLLNMFQAPLCPSSGAREYYTGGCCLCYLVLWFSSCRYDIELRVIPSAPHYTDNLKTKAPNTTGSNHLYNTLELLMMGIVVPETSDRKPDT